MEVRLKLKEAFARSEANGKKVFKRDLAKKLWPTSAESSQQVCMTKLLNGSSKRVTPEWVQIICKELNCTADFLFGLSND